MEMNTLTVKTSAKLLCGAVLAAVATTADVSAVPGAINVQTFAYNPNVPSYSLNNAVHQFGGPATEMPPGGFYSVLVTSGLSNRPGWDYELTVDYANFGTAFFGNPATGWRFVINLTIADTDAIGAVTVKDSQGVAYAVPPGIVTFGANNISVDLLATQVIAGGDIVTIQWAVPAPGALALLGFAGVVGKRRRRN